MIILDTNVLSELMRPSPNDAVLAWIAARPRAELHTTSITQAEILHGIALMPEGRRRSDLLSAADAMFAEDLAGRVLPFDGAAAAAFAALASARRRMGRPIAGFDALIAAIAVAAEATVATRDLDGFADCGVPLIDPWRTPASGP